MGAAQNRTACDGHHRFQIMKKQSEDE